MVVSEIDLVHLVATNTTETDAAKIARTSVLFATGNTLGQDEAHANRVIARQVVDAPTLKDYVLRGAPACLAAVCILPGILTEDAVINRFMRRTCGADEQTAAWISGAFSTILSLRLIPEGMGNFITLKSLMDRSLLGLSYGPRPGYLWNCKIS